MLSHVDLKKGITFVFQGDPCVVLDHSLMFKGRGSSVMQVRFKNLRNGTVLNRSFHTGEEFEEADFEKVEVKFIYENRGKYVFSEAKDPSKRFELTQEQVGEQSRFLIPNTILEAVRADGEMLAITLPIKMSLKIKEAPPGIKGDRAQGGTKGVIVETGAEVQAPLFVETGDVIEINTETGEYVRRVQ